jgi:hypothetical protein
VGTEVSILVRAGGFFGLWLMVSSGAIILGVAAVVSR